MNKKTENLMPLVASFLTKNKEYLKKYNECVCIYCGKKFRFMDITDWIDDGLTALCPFCSIDSVIPMQVHSRTDDYIMSDKLIEEIKKLYGG